MSVSASRVFPLAAILTLLTLALTTQGAADDPPLQAVIHVNFDDAKRQEGGLRNIEAILAEVGDEGARIEVVCHSDGIGLVVTQSTPYADAIKGLQARGVRFAACRNTMNRKGLKPEDLLEGVTIVPSGALRVVRLQEEGYSYFRP